MASPLVFIKLTESDQPVYVNIRAICAFGGSEVTEGGTLVVLRGGASVDVDESTDEVVAQIMAAEAAL